MTLSKTNKSLSSSTKLDETCNYGDFVYVWKLRTLSKKEIRNLKLND